MENLTTKEKARLILDALESKESYYTDEIKGGGVITISTFREKERDKLKNEVFTLLGIELPTEPKEGIKVEQAP